MVGAAGTACRTGLRGQKKTKTSVRQLLRADQQEIEEEQFTAIPADKGLVVYGDRNRRRTKHYVTAAQGW